jgi:hypothetical protein
MANMTLPPDRRVHLQVMPFAMRCRDCEAAGGADCLELP